MDAKGMHYTFSSNVYHYSASKDMTGWTIVSLPKEMSEEIRDTLGWLEQGWGRLKVVAKVGNSEWQTAIWFDTKQETYLLPLKAEIRRKERIVLDELVTISLWI